MLPELIYREEQHENYLLLFVFGLVSGLSGFAIGWVVLQDQASILAVIFAAIPLVYPLTRSFLEDEKNGKPHIGEIFQYSSLFAGEVLAFFLLVFLVAPENLDVQISQFAAQLDMMGIQSVGGSTLADLTGRATAEVRFLSIFLHNLKVFMVILTVSALVSSSGAFILTWNASVLGVFMGILAKNLDGVGVFVGSGTVPTPFAYVPHASLEMAGFIVAGISGSLISAAIYREHFDKDTWIDYMKLIGLGIGLVLMAAVFETA